ncbi:hypothetical protein CC78DRAFT_432072, partial [Lojkania enalia]
METYHGHVRTPQDAVLLFEACRIGLLPRVQRRLSEKERQQIKSGSVFVWDEREAGMRRWTDGKSWSASRVSGSFLTYREMEGKRGGSTFTPAPVPKRPSGKSPDGSATGDSDGEGPDGYRYKPDGLMKQSFSITTSSGQHLHLISYYARSSPEANNLQQPTQDPQLRHIRPPKNMYPESSVNETTSVPAVTRGPMPGSPYAHSPQQMSSSSPYSRPPPQPPLYIPGGNYPLTPNGTPPIQYTYYPPGASPIPYGQIVYAHPQAFTHHPPAHTAFDRVPPPLQHPHQPPVHPMLATHPYAHPQYKYHPSPRPLQPSEFAPQQPQPPTHPNGQHHVPPPNPSLPEQSVTLPALNGVPAVSGRTDNKPPSPQPSDPRAPDTLNVSTTNGLAVNAPSPARTIPSVGALLNGHPTDNSTDV